mgnify:CR=1 FL=1
MSTAQHEHGSVTYLDLGRSYGVRLISILYGQRLPLSIHIQRNDTIRGIFDWHTFRERFAQTQDDWMLLKPQLGYLIGLPVANERVVPTFANRHAVIVSVANSRTIAGEQFPWES